MLKLSKIVIRLSALSASTGITLISLTSGFLPGQILPSAQASPVKPAQNTPNLNNTAWQLRSLGTAKPIGEKPITLSFTQDRLSGSSGCNRYMGGFKVKGNELTIGSPLASTMMACPEDLMKQEGTFLKALSSAKNYTINGKGELEIQYRDGQKTQTLVFTPAPMSSTNRLDKTSWQLVSMGQTKPVTARPITVRFERNRIGGSAGCNRFMGNYSVQGNQLDIKSPLGTTRMACPGDTMKHESDFLQALAAANRYEINAKGELKIQYQDGQTTQTLTFIPDPAYTKGIEKIIYVNSQTVPCTGVMRMDCLQVKESAAEQWRFFYGAIEGFTFEPGNLYKLKVREERIPNPPADSSDRKWILVEILEKSPARN
ncbi:MAG: META and DUF4377 domain-containing protein [Snowella sp.]|nr:META and DUF4377 domain-containing protein [Snowella sp.]